MTIIYITIITIISLIILTLLITEFLPVFGKTKIKTKKIENIKSIDFENKTKIVKEMIKIYSQKIKNKNPNKTIQNEKLNHKIINKPENKNKTQITWFGHSTILIQANGINIITDPVFSKRASPFQFMGPKKFKYKHELNIKDLEKLPTIDYLLLSHDHYDHLDYETVKKLNKKVKQFLVPTGNKNHLTSWGIDENKIQEFNWWEEYKNQKEKLMFAYTPTQHFSGRKLTDQSKTLWGSWVIKINNQNIYFSADSGYFDGFKKIGKKYGPFDLTFMENGAYSKLWPKVHMFPNETLQAHIDVKGKYLMPIHWGKFDLSQHKWTEPIEKLIQLAKPKNQKIITPKLFQTFELENIEKIKFENWWEKYK